MSKIKICNFAEEQIQELRTLKKLCEAESGWEPPQEYLDEWVKAVLGISRHDKNLVKTAFNGKIVGYCVAVKKLHSYEGVVMDITWKTRTYGTFTSSRNTEIKVWEQPSLKYDGLFKVFRN